MARVFISYASEDPRPTRELASALEDIGIDVWWDTSLLPASTFSKQIDAQLDAADAVIVIWSPKAKQSDWVVAEAEHARRQGKLINCRTNRISPEDLPKPFNAIHCVEWTDFDAILRALEQLGVVEIDREPVAPNVEHQHSPEGWQIPGWVQSAVIFVVCGAVGILIADIGFYLVTGRGGGFFF